MKSITSWYSIWHRVTTKPIRWMIAWGMAISCFSTAAHGEESQAEPAWRPLPLIAGGKVAEGWCHVGWGGFVVEEDTLRTECDPKGLGLLVYQKERFGNCQLRVVFKSKEAKSNAGVFVRIDDGILQQVNQPGAAFDRGANGKISTASAKLMMASADREEGPWFAVHRGYEVQIMDASDPFHRTGALYSFAASSAKVNKPPGEWKTMIITLAGNRILVDLEGQRVTNFDPQSPEVPRERKWFEGKREPKRPETGYIGLQNHDPGDIVWFREISVRPWPKVEKSATAEADTYYVFTSFRGNGEDGLHLALSRDGYHWKSLNQNQPFLRPEIGDQKLMRDPCLAQGPDGKFHLVWTTGWTAEKTKVIGYANSKDLVHWSAQHPIPLMDRELLKSRMSIWCISTTMRARNITGL